MNKNYKMIIVLSVIGLISGSVLAGVYRWALPKIQANQIRETDASIYRVMPATKTYTKYVEGELTYFECFDSGHQKIGYAILCKGNGYQGEIKLMVGIKVDLSKFTGMAVLEQLETPGLGAKIAEKKFEKQFAGLAVKPPIEYVKGKAPEKNNQVQAITGATISSRSVVNIINKAVEQWMKIE